MAALALNTRSAFARRQLDHRRLAREQAGGRRSRPRRRRCRVEASTSSSSAAAAAAPPAGRDDGAGDAAQAGDGIRVEAGLTPYWMSKPAPISEPGDSSWVAATPFTSSTPRLVRGGDEARRRPPGPWRRSPARRPGRRHRRRPRRSCRP